MVWEDQRNFTDDFRNLNMQRQNRGPAHWEGRYNAPRAILQRPHPHTIHNTSSHHTSIPRPEFSEPFSDPGRRKVEWNAPQSELSNTELTPLGRVASSELSTTVDKSKEFRQHPNNAGMCSSKIFLDLVRGKSMTTPSRIEISRAIPAFSDVAPKVAGKRNQLKDRSAATTPSTLFTLGHNAIEFKPDTASAKSSGSTSAESCSLKSYTSKSTSAEYEVILSSPLAVPPSSYCRHSVVHDTHFEESSEESVQGISSQNSQRVEYSCQEDFQPSFGGLMQTALPHPLGLKQQKPYLAGHQSSQVLFQQLTASRSPAFAQPAFMRSPDPAEVPWPCGLEHHILTTDQTTIQMHCQFIIEGQACTVRPSGDASHIY